MRTLKALARFHRLVGPIVMVVVLAGCADGDTKYVVGGAVSGLTGTGLVLVLNGANDLPVSASGTFSFRRKLASGATYGVSVLSHPVGQGCVVANRSGVIGAAAIADVMVTCSTAGVLTLSSTNPINGAIGMARSFTPALVFSAPLSISTAIPANISLQSAAGSHAAAASVAGNTLTISPGRKLLPLTAYTLTVGTGVRGDSGETLAAAVATTFTTRDGAWQVPERRVSNDTDESYSVRIAAAANGNAIAMWIQFNSQQGDSGWWSNYTPGVGWGMARQLGTIDGYHHPVQDLVMDANGNAMAIWETYGDADCGRRSCTRKNVWMRRFSTSHGWGEARRIATEVSDSEMQQQLAMDAAGNAFLVWSQYDGTRRSIWARRQAVDEGWSAATLLDTGDGEVSDPEIATNANGDAIAVWQQQNGDHLQIWSSRYTRSTGWGETVAIQTDAMFSSDAPQVALDASGNAVAVWQQSDGQHASIWSNHYIAGAGWGTAEMIDTPLTGYASIAQLAMDAQGNAMAVWNKAVAADVGAPPVYIWSNRYVANTGWAAATPIETDDTGSPGDPLIVADARGNALAIWTQYDGTRSNVWSNRYVADSGWGAPTLLETDDFADALLRGIAIDGNGDATAAWMLAHGSEARVFTARFE